MKNRIKYIDVAKLIAVVCVLIDHMQYNIYIENQTAFMIIRVVWISFFMQILFIVAGITSRYPEVRSLKEFGNFVNKKIGALLVPYVVWCFFLNYSGKHDLNFFINMFLGTVESLEKAGINSVLWFLPVLFIANLFTCLIKNIVERVNARLHININILYLVCICNMLFMDRMVNVHFSQYLFWGMRSAFCGTAFILVGIMIKNLLKKIYQQTNLLTMLGLAIMLFLLGIPLAYYNMPIVFNADGSISYSYAIWMAKGYVGRDVILFFIVSCILSVAVILLAMCLEHITILCYCGQRSLLFMTGHIYTHSIVANYFYPYLTIVPASLRGSIFILLSIMLILLTLPCIDRWLPFLYKNSGQLKYTGEHLRIIKTEGVDNE